MIKYLIPTPQRHNPLCSAHVPILSNHHSSPSHRPVAAATPPTARLVVVRHGDGVAHRDAHAQVVQEIQIEGGIDVDEVPLADLMGG